MRLKFTVSSVYSFAKCSGGKDTMDSSFMVLSLCCTKVLCQQWNVNPMLLYLHVSSQMSYSMLFVLTCNIFVLKFLGVPCNFFII